MGGEWISGNKGEWSELYVFFKVLGDGRIYGADGNIKRKPDVYLDVNRVIRHDDGRNLVFVRVPERELVQVFRDGEEYTTFAIPAIIEQYGRLFMEIRRGKNSFNIPDTEKFMRSIGCTTLKAPSNDKTDITIEVYEPKTGMDLIQGFGIISMLGNPSTLVNASGATNFLYSLDGGMTEEIAEKANGYRNSNSKTKVIDMLTYLKNQGITLRFIDTDKRALFNNLTLIDSSMPELVGEMLILYYQEGISKISNQIDRLNRKNPLKFRNPDEVPYYEYKIKKLLVSYALGMQSSKPWVGVEDANGGYIIVREDGDVLCYHIFDRRSFEEYLIRNTKFDTPSIDRHGFAYVYNENGEYKLKLNMQIRFI